jgi:hypothetical protein
LSHTAHTIVDNRITGPIEAVVYHSNAGEPLNRFDIDLTAYPCKQGDIREPADAITLAHAELIARVEHVPALRRQ